MGHKGNVLDNELHGPFCVAVKLTRANSNRLLLAIYLQSSDFAKGRDCTGDRSWSTCVTLFKNTLELWCKLMMIRGSYKQQIIEAYSRQLANARTGLQPNTKASS